MKRKNIIPYETVGRIMEHFGIERVSMDAKVELSKYLEEYADRVGKLAIAYAGHAKRSTVTKEDIQLAIKNLEK